MTSGTQLPFFLEVAQKCTATLTSEQFWQAAKRYLPALQPTDLSPDTWGIRPKLQGPGQPWCDFVIAEQPPGLINLVGIESPGLTAALAIGEEVRRLARVP